MIMNRRTPQKSLTSLCRLASVSHLCLDLHYSCCLRNETHASAHKRKRQCRKTRMTTSPEQCAFAHHIHVASCIMRVQRLPLLHFDEADLSHDHYSLLCPHVHNCIAAFNNAAVKFTFLMTELYF